MATTHTEMNNSYVFIIDLDGQKISNGRVDVKVETDGIICIGFNYVVPLVSCVYRTRKKFDLPRDANLDEISAVSHKGMLIVMWVQNTA
ncbi:hypothetical protein MKW98_016257 [Papaver atlanticum]|uniref:SHSP domain-containing protein n=1 Tax=Papaver atlanticum TaxID=357466 RepID=A0AAD4SH39_9MAGN|nr:hypothetical protein MKW98_016257 [Papaver atlanticum]